MIEKRPTKKKNTEKHQQRNSKQNTSQKKKQQREQIKHKPSKHDKKKHKKHRIKNNKSNQHHQQRQKKNNTKKTTTPAEKEHSEETPRKQTLPSPAKKKYTREDITVSSEATPQTEIKNTSPAEKNIRNKQQQRKETTLEPKRSAKIKTAEKNSQDIEKQHIQRNARYIQKNSMTPS